MTEKKPDNQSPPAVAKTLLPAVVRSSVPAGRRYPEYKRFLRRDFLFSCAYCTMTESEAEAIRFTIDHYEPKSARPDLEDAYENLMWACDQCNTLKGPRHPTTEMRDAGNRFFKADQDVRIEHFSVEGTTVKGLTPVGNFTAVAVDLNRPSLIRLRKLRRRFYADDEYVNEGIAVLLSFPVDRLPREARARAFAAINQIKALVSAVVGDLDEAFLQLAMSSVLGDDDEVTAEEIQRNKARLRELDGIHPGAWHGRKRKDRVK
jgi:5-methylcytosine-specific restriction endonuclease McrA